MKNKQLPFWILTIAISSALLLPLMVQEGLFTDGILYAAVSRNLAHNFGTFWFPKFDEVGIAGLSTFHEHPPLYFGIQSLFFRAFGDGFFVEKFYSLVAALTTALFIIVIWKKINTNRPELNKLGWLPVLFWITIAIVFYAYQNNLIEGTMSIFMLAAFYFIWKATIEKSTIYLNVFLGGIFIFLGSFTKGVPGFFPLAIPGIIWLIKRSISFKQMIVYTLILLLVPVVIYTLLVMTNEAAFTSLSLYVEKRLLGRIESAPTATNRFYILGQLFFNLLPLISITLILYVVKWFKIKTGVKDINLRKDFVVFFLIGLSGSVPLMLTMVQKAFYFVHAMPFLAISFALIAAPTFSMWINSIKSTRILTILNSVFVSALIVVLIYTGIHFGKTGRDRELLHDVHLLGETIPNRTIVNIDISMHNNWALHCYLSRYYDISIHTYHDTPEYLLLDKTLAPDKNLPLHNMELPLKLFDLYKFEEKPE